MTKLFMAVMYATDELFDSAKNDLVLEYGGLRAESDAYEFDFTHYYDKEMGPGLKKKFLVFEKDVSKEELILQLKQDMQRAAEELNFERAIELREKLLVLQGK